MKKWKMILTAAMPLAMALSFPAFAGEWHEDMNGWWYENDDGSYCRNGWYWPLSCRLPICFSLRNASVRQ